jgi:hypothetical protein
LLPDRQGFRLSVGEPTGGESSNWLRQQLDCPEKHQGVILADTVVYDERSDGDTTDQHAQRWQPIEWLPAIQGVGLKTFRDVAKRSQHVLSAPLAFRLALNSDQRLGNHRGAVNLKTRFTTLLARHGYAFFLGLEDPARWTFSIAARILSTGMPCSISVYCCRSAAVNS